MTIFIAALTPMYRTHILHTQSMIVPTVGSPTDSDLKAINHAIGAIRNEPYNEIDLLRGDLLASMVAKVYGSEAAEGKLLSCRS